MAVLDNELNCIVLGVHIRHLSFNVHVSHDSRGKNHGQVARCHLAKSGKLRTR